MSKRRSPRRWFAPFERLMDWLAKTPAPKRKSAGRFSALNLEGLEDRTVPAMLIDIVPGGQGSYPQGTVDVGGTAFFVASNGTSGSELWKSDGTAGGTVLVSDIFGGNYGSYPSNLTNVNGTLFFTANDGVNGRELWKSDGTAAGTVLVSNVYPGNYGSYPGNLTNVNGLLAFSAFGSGMGNELWRSDGTVAGTVLVNDIRPGFYGSYPQNFEVIGSYLAFSANNGTNGTEPWLSNGLTPGGAFLLKDVRPGANGSYPTEFTNANAQLFFAANDGTTGNELWLSTAPTAAATNLLKDISTTAKLSSSNPANLTNVNGTLFFAATNSGTGRELWSSNGTAAGTAIVKDVFSGTGNSSNPAYLTNANGVLFFAATTATSGRELWSSNGTAAGTVIVRDVFPGTTGSDPRYLTNVSGTVFFSASGQGTGRELWRSDGSLAGTTIEQDINPGGASSDPGSLAGVGLNLFFTAFSPAAGSELWTAVGDVTSPSVTINQGATQADPTNVGTIVFDVVFSESVTGFDMADVFLSGPAAAGATVAVAGAGTTYTVTVSGVTVNGVLTASIPAGAAQDPTGNLSLASTSTDNSVTFDNVGPTVTINQGATQLDPTNASPIVFDVVFSEPVGNFATGDVSLGGTALPSTAIVTEAGPMDGTTYTVSVSGMVTSGTVIAFIGSSLATDLAGNPNAASTSTDNTVTYDNVAPTVTINQGATQLDPTNVSPIVFDVVFSESVANFATGDVTLSGTAGATTAVVAEAAPFDGTSYTVTVSGMTGDGTVIASIAGGVATDVAGNGNAASTSTDNTVTFDTTAPTVTINQGATQLDPTNASPIVFDVVFSESVADFATGDVTLSGTAGATTAVVAEVAPFDGTTYTVSVSGMTGDGTVIASLLAGVATDAAGNGNAASTSTDNTVTFDTTAPTVTINQGAGQLDPTNSTSIVFDVVFGEPVTGFDPADVALTGTSVGSTAVSVTETGPMDGTTYEVAVTAGTDGTVIADIAAGGAFDLAGNGNAPSTSTDNTVTVDTTAPDTTITSNPTDPTNSTNATFLFTGTDPAPGTGIFGFQGTLDGVPFSHGFIAGLAFGGLSDGVHTFTVSAIDGAGNVDPTPASFTWLVDTTGPTTTLLTGPGVDAPPQTNDNTPTFTFSGDDGTGVGGITFEVSIDGGAFAAATSPFTTAALADGTHTIEVRATDSLGNVGPIASASFTVDTVAPTVTINQGSGQADPTVLSPIVFDVVFNEPVTGFDGADVTLGGTALPTTAFVTETGPMDGTTFTVSVSGMTATGTVTATINAGVATDLAGNANAASTSTDNTVDYTLDDAGPIVTISPPSSPVTTTGPITYTVTYTDPNFSFSNLIPGFNLHLVSTGTATGTLSVDGSSGNVVVVTISNITGTGTLAILIDAGSAFDTIGNAAPAAGPSTAVIVQTPLLFDMNTPTSGSPAGWNNVTTVTNFATSGTGFGWSQATITGAALQSGVGSAPAGVPGALTTVYTDFIRSKKDGVFQITGPTNANVRVTVYTLPSGAGMLVNAEGGTVAQGANQTVMTVFGNVGADGRLDITFSKGTASNWVVAGLLVEYI